MPKEVELEGTPAEATWAMITVIVVVIVVIIFCCLVPFYRALEKRYHHWDDIEHDPRWDQDQFQFSPTSPTLARSASQRSNGGNNYNRLSVCSAAAGEDESSVTTSNSNINNSFRNNCVLPRMSDQVEFKLPKKFDDGFNRAAVIDESVIEEDETTPQLKKQNLDNKKQDKSSPASKKVGNFQKKPSPLTLSRDERVEVDERKVKEAGKTISAKQTAASPPASKQDALNKRIEEQRQKQAERLAQAQSKASANQSSVPPIAPPKRNSRLMSPTEERRAVNGPAPVMNGHSEPTVTAPARKSYKKPRKPDPAS